MRQPPSKDRCPRSLIVPQMGGTEDDLARVIGTIFFVSGIITLVQTVFGDRLPIIQARAPHLPWLGACSCAALLACSLLTASPVVCMRGVCCSAGLSSGQRL